jgi:hypothetical protein
MNPEPESNKTAVTIAEMKRKVLKMISVMQSTIHGNMYFGLL